MHEINHRNLDRPKATRWTHECWNNSWGGIVPSSFRSQSWKVGVLLPSHWLCPLPSSLSLNSRISHSWISKVLFWWRSLCISVRATKPSCSTSSYHDPPLILDTPHSFRRPVLRKKHQSTIRNLVFEIHPSSASSQVKPGFPQWHNIYAMSKVGLFVLHTPLCFFPLTLGQASSGPCVNFELLFLSLSISQMFPSFWYPFLRGPMGPIWGPKAVYRGQNELFGNLTCKIFKLGSFSLHISLKAGCLLCPCLLCACDMLILPTNLEFLSLHFTLRWLRTAVSVSVLCHRGRFQKVLG